MNTHKPTHANSRVQLQPLKHSIDNHKRRRERARALTFTSHHVCPRTSSSCTRSRACVTYRARGTRCHRTHLTITPLPVACGGVGCVYCEGPQTHGAKSLTWPCGTAASSVQRCARSGAHSGACCAFIKCVRCFTTHKHRRTHTDKNNWSQTNARSGSTSERSWRQNGLTAAKPGYREHHSVRSVRVSCDTCHNRCWRVSM